VADTACAAEAGPPTEAFANATRNERRVTAIYSHRQRD
jgi:hypothetical protein